MPKNDFRKRSRYKRFRNAGANKTGALIQMAQNGGIYAPAFTPDLGHAFWIDVVDKPIDPRVPEVVERAFVEDINDYPFPDESPVAAAEAIFDRRVLR